MVMDLAGKIPEEVIEQIRTQSDIVDVISEYMRLTKRGRNGLVSVHFMESKHRLFLYLQTSKFFIALVVVQGQCHYFCNGY